MPGIDGIELLSRARKIHEDIIFILLSGYDLFEYAQKAIQHGAFLIPFKTGERHRIKIHN